MHAHAQHTANAAAGSMPVVGGKEACLRGSQCTSQDGAHGRWGGALPCRVPSAPKPPKPASHDSPMYKGTKNRSLQTTLGERTTNMYASAAALWARAGRGPHPHPSATGGEGERLGTVECQQCRGATAAEGTARRAAKRRAHTEEYACMHGELRST